MRKSFILTLLFVAYATSLRAEEAMVAVAANFSAPMQQIAALFKKKRVIKLSYLLVHRAASMRKLRMVRLLISFFLQISSPRKS
jgi:hypothetical protein